jgi:mRNA interferase YafQ
MLELHYGKRFEKDVKLAQKRGRQLQKLWDIVRLLQHEQPLPAKCRAHRLVGNWIPHWECHIEPDWLLIYLCDETTLTLVRCGSHADLF